MVFTVTADGDGVLLRSYLKRLSLSNKLIARLKRIENGITVNDEHVTVRHILKEGDVINLAIEDTESNESLIPIDVPVDIVYEDSDLAVCNKPPFMPTHPSCDHYDDTLANALAYIYRDVPFVFRPVNRLDKNTSGAVLVAKNARGASMLFSEMKKRNIEKTYIAITEGEFNGSGLIDKPLCRTDDSIIVRRVCDISEEGAKTAQTEYTVLCSKNGMSVVRLRPLTGRTHQIRVHLASIGHPIIGDELYGHESELISRQALHAESLTFTKPSDKERLCVKAPLPDDMKKLAGLAGYITE